MSWEVIVKPGAKNDIKRALRSPLRAKLLDIIATLKDNPYTPTHSLEKLKPPIEGKYSRRLNGQHRVVYKVDKENKIVYILSAWSHYE